MRFDATGGVEPRPYGGDGICTSPVRLVREADPYGGVQEAFASV